MNADILLATYNGEAFLDELIDSIFSQTGGTSKLLICDDGSTDATQSILQGYQKRFPEQIHISYNQKNQGTVASFSSLMQLSKAPFIFFADQDDVWCPDKMKRCIDLAKQYPEQTPLLIHTDCTVVDSTLREMHRSLWKHNKVNLKKAHSPSRILTQNVVTGCTMMINRALVNLSLPIPKEAMMHDWWVALVASHFGTIVPLHERLVLYRQHEKNQIGIHQFHRDTAKQTHKQATAFLNHYTQRLTESQKDLLKAFLAIPQKNNFHRLKHRFLWNGFLRNLYHFFFDTFS